MQNPESFLSIDQNSHSLWDTLPKLQVLARHNIAGTHLLEDIDTAFTRRGGRPGDDDLELARERVYRDGSMDWGAALFYSDFLGRTPVDAREIETYTGNSVKSLARKAAIDVDELFRRYGASDNWQLIGTSYAAGESHHRTVGDLQAAEIEPFLHALIEHARKDLWTAFPEAAARNRIAEWFDAEQKRVNRLLDEHRNSPLTRLYHAWLGEYLDGSSVSLDYTSNTLGFQNQSGMELSPLLSLITARYREFSECYNQALAETRTGITPLDTDTGELPLFAVWRQDQRLTRSPTFLKDGRIHAAGYSWPLTPEGAPPVAAMQKDGVVALAGKALVLVLQVRLPPYSKPLVLPHQGSLYMPAAHRLAALLRERHLIEHDPESVYRVRFHLLERMRETDTIIRLPAYLQSYCGTTEMSASTFAVRLPNCIEQADSRLGRLRDDATREAEIADITPQISARIRELETRRRELARNPETRSQASEVWKEIKPLYAQQTEELMQGIMDALHIQQVDYWDSRGALMPWSIALGGEEFYRRVIEQAEIYADTEAQ